MFEKIKTFGYTVLVKTFAGNDPRLAEQVKSNWASVVACSYAEAKHIPILQGSSCGSLKQ